MQTEQLLCWTGMTDTEHKHLVQTKKNYFWFIYMSSIILQNSLHLLSLVILLLNFYFIYLFFQHILIFLYLKQWCSKGEGASGGTRLGAQALRAHQHTFAVILKIILSRNLNQSMLKNAYFLVKIRFRVGGSAPEPSLASGGWVSAPRPLRCTNFASLKFLQLFFTSNSVVFVGRGRKNISCSRAQGTLATSLIWNTRKLMRIYNEIIWGKILTVLTPAPLCASHKESNESLVKK